MPQTVELVPSLPFGLFTSDTAQDTSHASDLLNWSLLYHWVYLPLTQSKTLTMPQTVELVPSLPLVLFTSDTVQDTSHASDLLNWSLLYHLVYLPQTQSKTLNMPQTVELVPSLPLVLFTSDTAQDTSHASDLLNWSLLYHLVYLPQTQSKTLHMPQTVELVPSLPLVLFTSETDPDT